ncbi:MAG: ABC transporter substrate-binding protein, partial [bacterium]
EPQLAESLPEISPDGLVYTFKIRKGIFFQNDPCFTNSNGKGRELAAEDFVYSFKRLADIKNEATGYWLFDDRIVGLDEFRTMSAGKHPTEYSLPVEGLQALDRYTLRIILKKPYPQLLWALTMDYAYAVPHEAVEYYKREFLNHPVGTGPYILSAWQRNYRVEYIRNPKWAETGRKEIYPEEGTPDDKGNGLLADAGRTIPFVDRLVQYVIDDESTQWLLFVTGDLESSGVSRDNMNAVLMKGGVLADSLARRGVVLNKSQRLDVYYLGFNMDDPVVGDSSDPVIREKHKKLRQALTCAFNSEDWVKFYHGRITRAKGPIPPGIPDYEDKPTPYPFDLDKAKLLLAGAGYKDGLNPETGRALELSVEMGGADTQQRQAIELVTSFMSKIGIRLNPSYNNWPTFLMKMERRQAQMYQLGWVADYPDAENFLQLFYGKNASPGPNHSNYLNPEYDSLYEKMRIMKESPERTELCRKMSAMVAEDCPWIFMHHPIAYGLQHCWMKNYKPHDFAYGMTKYYRIDTDQRKQWRETYGRKNWQE